MNPFIKTDSRLYIYCASSFIYKVGKGLSVNFLMKLVNSNICRMNPLGKLLVFWWIFMNEVKMRKVYLMMFQLKLPFDICSSNCCLVISFSYIKYIIIYTMILYNYPHHSLEQHVKENFLNLTSNIILR